MLVKLTPGKRHHLQTAVDTFQWVFFLFDDGNHDMEDLKKKHFLHFELIT